MKSFRKAQIAGAVMLATAGVAVSTAQAESLLAPLVIQGTNGWNTYFAFKMGQTSSNRIHYTYLQKGNTVGALIEYTQGCQISDNTGAGSPGDMIYQRADGAKMYYTGLGLTTNAIDPNTGNLVDADKSSPNGFSTGPFVGMIVLNTDNDQDGDMSGFGYLVNPVGPTILDYKLLNNHHSTTEGDFSIGFISKTAVDFMWLSSVPNGGSLIPPHVDFAGNVIPGGIVPVTGWTLSVTGPDMAKHGLQADGTQWSSMYNATVNVSQQRRGGNTSPAEMVAGAFNNDEVVVSGDLPFPVTCMGSFTHNSFLTPLQNLSTQWGGWTRKSIVGQVGAPAAGYEARTATGAIVYRADSDMLNGLSAFTTMQVETGGHLAAGHNHVNRPY